MNEPVIIGVDPSTRKIAITVSIGDEIEMFKTPIKKSDTEQVFAYSWMQSQVFIALAKGASVFIFIEDPVLGFGKRANAQSLISQARAQGAILAGAQALHDSFPTRPVTVARVAPAEWKKKVIGKGNASKDEIRAWCREYWTNAYDLSEGDQDLIDSAGINRYGHGIVGIRKTLVKPLKKSPRRTVRSK